MDLNAGKPDPKEAAFNALFTLGAYLIAGIAALAFVWSLPETDFTGYIAWHLTNVIGILVSGLIVFATLRYGWAMGNITVKLWHGYHSRIERWNDEVIRSYRAMHGQEITNTVSIYELDPNVPSHVLITALLVQHRLAHAANQRELPWSTRGLADRLELTSGNNSVLLGELGGTRPERMSMRLAELGFISNRKPGSAGNWVPQSYDDIIENYARQWSKVKGITRQ